MTRPLLLRPLQVLLFCYIMHSRTVHSTTPTIVDNHRFFQRYYGHMQRSFRLGRPFFARGRQGSTSSTPACRPYMQSISGISPCRLDCWIQILPKQHNMLGVDSSLGLYRPLAVHYPTTMGPLFLPLRVHGTPHLPSFAVVPTPSLSPRRAILCFLPRDSDHLPPVSPLCLLFASRTLCGAGQSSSRHFPGFSVSRPCHVVRSERSWRNSTTNINLSG